MMKKIWAVLLSICLILSLASPAMAAPIKTSGAASTLRLESVDGTAQLTNASGKSVKTTNGARLYNGYELATEKASYAYVSLDDAKAIKLDASSSAEVFQSGKKLEMKVNSGKMFFNVTEPLKSDEALNIRTSTMVTGVRGTSGWIEVISRYITRVSLLEGTLTLTSVDPLTGVTRSVTIYGGQTATVVHHGEGKDAAPEIIVDGSSGSGGSASSTPGSGGTGGSGSSSGSGNTGSPSISGPQIGSDEEETIENLIEDGVIREEHIVINNPGLTVETLQEEDVPGFVAKEVKKDKELQEKITENSPLSVPEIIGDAEERLEKEEAAAEAADKAIQDAVEKLQADEVNPLFDAETPSGGGSSSGSGGGSSSGDAPGGDTGDEDTTPSTEVNAATWAQLNEAIQAYNADTNTDSMTINLQNENGGAVTIEGTADEGPLPAIAYKEDLSLTLNLKDSTLVLNGPLVNDGDLTITNNQGFIKASDDAEQIWSGDWNMIENYGTLIQEAAQIDVPVNFYGVYNYGTYTMTGENAKIIGDNGTPSTEEADGTYAVLVWNEGTFQLQSGLLTVGAYGHGIEIGSEGNCTFSMSGGTVNVAGEEALGIQSGGASTFSGGSISVTGTNAIGLSVFAAATLSGTVITAEQGTGVYLIGGETTFAGGSVTAEAGAISAVYCESEEYISGEIKSTIRATEMGNVFMIPENEGLAPAGYEIAVDESDSTYFKLKLASNVEETATSIFIQTLANFDGSQDVTAALSEDIIISQENIGTALGTAAEDLTIAPAGSSALTIDLAGNNLSMTDACINNTGNLTVIDSVGGGTISGTNTRLIKNSGTLTLTSGTLQMSDAKNYSYGIDSNGGTVNLDGMTLTVGGTQNTGIQYSGGIFNMTSGELNVDGGKNTGVDFSGTTYDTLNISGGTVSVGGSGADQKAFRASARTATTIEGNVTFNISNGTGVESLGDVEVNGGTFNVIATEGSATAFGGTATLEMTAGTINVDVAKTVESWDTVKDTSGIAVAAVEMTGGTIKVNNGAGIVANHSSQTDYARMNGGSIVVNAPNTALDGATAIGVHVVEDSFEFTGGDIRASGNGSVGILVDTSTSTPPYAYVSSTITVTNGTAIENHGETVFQGTIYANNDTASGKGVVTDGSFTMRGGSIVASRNTALNVTGGTVELSGGSITATAIGITAVKMADGAAFRAYSTDELAPIGTTIQAKSSNDVINPANRIPVGYEVIQDGTYYVLGEAAAPTEITVNSKEDFVKTVDQRSDTGFDGAQPLTVKLGASMTFTATEVQEILGLSTGGSNSSLMIEPEGAELLTIDLNGKTLSMGSSILNTGNLLITDTSDTSEPGVITGSATDLIINSGMLQLTGGTLKMVWSELANSTSAGTILVNGHTIYGPGTFNMTGGTIDLMVDSDFDKITGISSNASSEVTLSGGTIKTSGNGIAPSAFGISSSGILTLTENAIVDVQLGCGIDASGTTALNSGSVHVTGAGEYGVRIKGTATMNGTKILLESNANTTYGLVCDGGNVNLAGGSITADNNLRAAVNFMNNGTLSSDVIGTTILVKNDGLADTTEEEKVFVGSTLPEGYVIALTEDEAYYTVALDNSSSSEDSWLRFREQVIAFNSRTSPQTITLEGDITPSAEELEEYPPLTVGDGGTNSSTLTIDLAGNNLNLANKFTIAETGSLKIIDSTSGDGALNVGPGATLENKGSLSIGDETSISKLVIESDGTLNNTASLDNYGEIYISGSIAAPTDSTINNLGVVTFQNADSASASASVAAATVLNCTFNNQAIVSNQGDLLYGTLNVGGYVNDSPVYGGVTFSGTLNNLGQINIAANSVLNTTNEVNNQTSVEGDSVINGYIYVNGGYDDQELAGEFNLKYGAVLNNNSDIILNDGILNADSGSILNNFALAYDNQGDLISGGHLYVAGANGTLNIYDGATMNNNGYLEVNTPESAHVYGTLDNAGSIFLGKNTGRLVVELGGTLTNSSSTSSIVLQEGVLEINGTLLNKGSIFNGTDDYFGGRISVMGSLSNTESASLINGENGQLIIGDWLPAADEETDPTFQPGTLSNLGLLNNLAGGTLYISPGSTLQNDQDLYNSGTIQLGTADGTWMSHTLDIFSLEEAQLINGSEDADSTDTSDNFWNGYALVLDEGQTLVASSGTLHLYSGKLINYGSMHNGPSYAGTSEEDSIDGGIIIGYVIDESGGNVTSDAILINEGSFTNYNSRFTPDLGTVRFSNLGEYVDNTNQDAAYAMLLDPDSLSNNIILDYCPAKDLFLLVPSDYVRLIPAGGNKEAVVNIDNVRSLSDNMTLDLNGTTLVLGESLIIDNYIDDTGALVWAGTLTLTDTSTEGKGALTSGMADATVVVRPGATLNHEGGFIFNTYGDDMGIPDGNCRVRCEAGNGADIPHGVYMGSVADETNVSRPTTL